ncbi:BTN1 protein, putative [Entamoeba nuttalli P19]|uniref:Battenin n=1 Tax=Entamoeba nuttalli (strain P19) TaxID=1076696 RepID=K2GJ73_ENTNP|nr:BTN1 protein, putative [Entamoeba nuttalli P19]EKE42796.1 BTN1 protein, putative [Entamoeba nuttalli P19]|eukprot:XP_008854866.1 BTN1 protein, putative [Entamoeba nuttalli P19]
MNENELKYTMTVSKILKTIHLTKGWDYYRNYIGFFIIGTINNINFVVVNSAASSLCSFFKADKWNPLILWCNVFAGLILRILNILFLYKIPIKIRLLFSTIFNLVGLFGMVLCILLQEYTQTTSFIFFGLCLFMILIIGGVQSFAESVILSYSGRFPPEMVNGWSSGTGFAGVAGSGLYLFFTGLNIPNTISFTCLTPFCVIYAIVFFFMIKPEVSRNEEQQILINDTNNDRKQEKEHNEYDSIKEELKNELDLMIDEQKEEGTFLEKLKSGIKMTWWLGTNLTLIYFFEYVINPGAIYVAFNKEKSEESNNFFIKNFYEVLAFCYQLGVFISRSSLPLFKIKPVWILTIIQCVLCIFMSIQGNLHFMYNEWGIWLMIVIMLVVGLVGGSGYVQVMYWILTKQMKKEQRELGISFVTILNTLAVLASSLLSLLLNETLWKSNFDY